MAKIGSAYFAPVSYTNLDVYKRQALKQTSFSDDGLKYWKNHEARYKSIKLEDIKAVAKKYLDVNKMQIIRVLPSEKAMQSTK